MNQDISLFVDKCLENEVQKVQFTYNMVEKTSIIEMSFLVDGKLYTQDFTLTQLVFDDQILRMFLDTMFETIEKSKELSAAVDNVITTE
jgi:hypothetical protein